jgi:5'-3' exonuclease
MKERKKILLIDMANMGIRTAMACFRDDPTDTRYVGWKSEILKSLVWLMRETEANSLILAMEGKKCWRYEVFDQYKAHRKEEKAKAKMDFETYYPMFDSFCSLLRQYMPNIYQIKVPRAEGDDVVAAITKHLTPDYDVICVSTDRDFYQLLKYPGYRQFHPIKRKYVEVLNPERYLLEKVIVGDKGDGVPHVKPRVSIKTAPKIIDEGLEEWIDREGVRAEFERNKTLIDFDRIPIEVETAIIDELKNYKWEPMSKRDVINFFQAADCMNLFDKSPQYANAFSSMERVDVK